MAVDIEIQQAGTWPTYRLTLTRSGCRPHADDPVLDPGTRPGRGRAETPAGRGAERERRGLEYASRYTGV